MSLTADFGGNAGNALTDASGGFDADLAGDTDLAVGMGESQALGLAGISARPPDPALQLRFDVRIDGQSLPTFTAVDGISAEYEIEEVKEGGNNAYVHRLPGRLKYPNLKLTRACDQHSAALAAWFTKTQDGVPGAGTAIITAYSGDRSKIASWSFKGVLPVRYTGPSFTVTGSAAATESLELVHNGFTFEQGEMAALAGGAAAAVGGAF